jgi:hypothetical protein
VWGDPHKADVIFVDEQQVAVTKNLYEALRELQYSDKERTLWVDAVCINQSDDEERTHQVSQMRHIYKRASSVVVYLGHVWEGCGDAFEFFEKSARDANLHYAETTSPCVEVDGKTLGSSEHLRNYVARFFDLTWWRRLWTVQEFVLAKKTTFQCGPYVISEEVLLQSFHHVRTHTRSCCSITPLTLRDPSSGLSNWDLYNRIDSLRQLRSWKQGYTFFRILASFRIRQSYDPRDKVFGLLGLAVEDWTCCIIPDYTQSAEDVYRAVVTAYVESTGNLEFLSYCNGNRILGLRIPSFVPDWTASVDENLNANYTNRGVTSCFDASNGAPAEMIFTATSQATFTGLVFDKVTHIGSSAPAARLSAAELQCWREFAGIKNTTHTAMEDLTDADIAFGATLCGGIGSDWTDGDYFMRRATVEQDWPRFNKWQAWVDSDHDLSAFNGDVMAFSAAYATVALGRRLVSTSNGHLAFVPDATTEGDVIAVLAGGKLPYVLRPFQDGDDDDGSGPVYTFIGDAYIWGIMDGEIWPEDDTDLSQIEMR